jgi:hypothetical protein
MLSPPPKLYLLAPSFVRGEPTLNIHPVFFRVANLGIGKICEKSKTRVFFRIIRNLWFWKYEIQWRSGSPLSTMDIVWN